ncbi:hypothetical protein BDV12DRAFT_195350 [Aspergillus spectabilis]
MSCYLRLQPRRSIPTVLSKLYGGTVDVHLTWTTPFSTSELVTITVNNGTPSATSTETTTDATTSGTAFEPTEQTSTTAGISSSFDQPALPSASNTQSHGSDSSSRSSGNEFSNGALAGAIVGSIVGTALLTFFLAVLFYRRSQTPTASGEVENGAGSNTKSGTIISTSALSGENPHKTISLAAITPHPADDEAVRSRILTLVDHASLHVDNYYVSTSPPGQLSQDAVARLAKYNADFIPGSHITALGRHGKQRRAITHILLHTLLQAIRPGGELLPKLLAAQPQVDNSLTCTFQHITISDIFLATENALFAWRMITAYIYNQGAYNKDPTHNTARDQASEALAAEFTTIFSPYALVTFSESDRIFHLTKLANSTAELGIWLFAQPCTFEFVWNKVESELTLVPKVIKTHDEQGKRLATPQVLIEATQANVPTLFELDNPL